MNSKCKSARRNSWSRGWKRRGGVLLWRKSACRDWKRRKYVLMAKIKKTLFLVRVITQLWIMYQHWGLFSESRSVMNQQCVRHRRKANGPNRTKMQEEGSSPRPVSLDECAVLFSSLLTWSFFSCITTYLSLSILCVSSQFLDCLIALFLLHLQLYADNTLVPRRLPLTIWEKNLVSRLLTPTCSYLARSKSVGCHSGEEGTLPQNESVCCGISTMQCWRFAGTTSANHSSSLRTNTTHFQFTFPSFPLFIHIFSNLPSLWHKSLAQLSMFVAVQFHSTPWMLPPQPLPLKSHSPTLVQSATGHLPPPAASTEATIWHR